MFNTIIIDDDPQAILRLRKLLVDYCPLIDVVDTSTDFESAYIKIKELKPSLILLDVVLPQGDAFELLDKLMPIDFEIIFITELDNYSMKALKYSALDYLLKPVELNDLQYAINKAIQKIKQKNVNHQLELFLANVKTAQKDNYKIAIPTLEGYVFLEINDIIRCEANGTYTSIYTIKKEKIVASKNIKEYEEMLPEKKFFRVHNSHLVNMNRIVKYTKGRGGTITMEDGAEVDVASRRRGDFLEMFQ